MCPLCLSLQSVILHISHLNSLLPVKSILAVITAKKFKIKVQVRISIGNVDVDLTLLIFSINQSWFCLFMRNKRQNSFCSDFQLELTEMIWLSCVFSSAERRKDKVLFSSSTESLIVVGKQRTGHHHWVTCFVCTGIVRLLFSSQEVKIHFKD